MKTVGMLILAVATVQAADRIAPGVLLVADKKLDDPNFRKTVILIADHTDEGTLGLVLNRRTEMPLSQVLDSWKEAARVKDPVFVGGPVGRAGMFALIRLKTALDGAKRVVGDIQLVTDRKGLAAHLGEGPAIMRVYAGYTGWGPDQLASEMSEGAWHVLPANPKFVFDDEPETLWQRLSHSAEMQVAGYKTNLYPTPWTVIRCLGSPCSSLARIPAM